MNINELQLIIQMTQTSEIRLNNALDSCSVNEWCRSRTFRAQPKKIFSSFRIWSTPRWSATFEIVDLIPHLAQEILGTVNGRGILDVAVKLVALVAVVVVELDPCETGEDDRRMPEPDLSTESTPTGGWCQMNHECIWTRHVVNTLSNLYMFSQCSAHL